MNKTYDIAGIKFVLKTDFELDESIQISNLLKNLFTETGDTLTGNFSGEEIKHFLKLVLEPVPLTSSGNGNYNAVAEPVKGSGRSMAAEPVEASFFGRIKESVQLEIFKDFFLDRIRKANFLAQELKDSMLQQEKF